MTMHDKNFISMTKTVVKWAKVYASVVQSAALVQLNEPIAIHENISLFCQTEYIDFIIFTTSDPPNCSEPESDLSELSLRMTPMKLTPKPRT